MNHRITKADSVDTPRFIVRNARRLWLCLLLGIVIVPLAWVKSSGHEHHGATQLRWDLINLSSDTPPVLSEGGVDSAKAADGSQITLTGSGTFLSVPGKGEAHGVSGGGTWETLDSTGASTGSGDYSVTGQIAYDEVPGVTPAAGADDKIGDPADSRAGLLILRVRYSDGEEGVLTVSCHGGGPVLAPASVFEGITATKSFVGYVDRGKPVAGVNANRTAFHILHQGGNDNDDD